MSESLSHLFVYWMSKQAKSGLLPSQIESVVNVMDRLVPADLILVLYWGNEKMASTALALLKKMFLDEMHFLNEEH